MAQNWILIISEQHRYQGVSYKSDIIVISGLDQGDRQVLEQKYAGCDPPCLLDSSDGRFVLKGVNYNPLDVMNCLMSRRGYQVEGEPQQRTLPNIHNKDENWVLENAHNLQSSSTRVTKVLAKSLIRRDSDISTYHQKFAIIYHMSKSVSQQGWSRVEAALQPSAPRSYSLGAKGTKKPNTAALAKQQSIDDAGLQTRKKIQYSPVLSPASGRRKVQRALSLAQKNCKKNDRAKLLKISRK